MPMIRKTRFLITALLASGGGWVAQQFGIPLAWLIGSMLVTLGLGLWFPISVPRPLYRSGQVIVGTAVGLTIAPDILGRIGPHLPVIIGGALVSITIGRALTSLVSRLSGLDMKTSFFAIVPAGISEMADLAARHGADSGAVALFHTLRVTFIVLFLPMLILKLTPSLVTPTASAGAWNAQLLLALLAGLGAGFLGNRLGLPSAFVVGPMLVLAALSVSGMISAREPDILLALAQIALGLSLGARFRRETLLRLPRALAGGVPVILLHAGLMLGLAFGVSALTGLAGPELLMGFATGGTAEMVLTAQIVAADAALVAAYQVTRGLLGNLLAGVIFRRTVADKSLENKG